MNVVISFSVLVVLLFGLAALFWWVWHMDDVYTAAERPAASDAAPADFEPAPVSSAASAEPVEVSPRSMAA